MLSWFSGEDDVGNLINRKKLGRAVRVLRQRLAERPRDVHLRQRLADVLALDGDAAGALVILDAMVDELAGDGFDAKAIAVLKKMQRIDPSRREIEEKLAGLIKRRDRGVWHRVGEMTIPARDPGEDAAGALEARARLPAVQRSPLFSTFQAGDLLAVIRGLSLRDFEPGEIVVSEKEPGDSLFVVASGSVRVYVRNASWHNTQIRVLVSSDFFGEISLLSGKPRTATVIAAEPTEILELDRETLHRIVEQHPQVPKIIREISEQRAMSPEELEGRGARAARRPGS